MSAAIPDLTDQARAAAAELLTEHAGRAYLSDLIALAYMRGVTAAYRELAVELRGDQPKEAA